MPRCKNIECRIKFVAKYFLQKYCSTECKDLADEPVKEINKKSEKRKQQEEIYKPLRKAYLLGHPFCERCNEERATEIHHKNGREGERLNDFKFFMAVDRNCHDYIHEHPRESREKGYLI